MSPSAKQKPPTIHDGVEIRGVWAESPVTWAHSSEQRVWRITGANAKGFVAGVAWWHHPKDLSAERIGPRRRECHFFAAVASATSLIGFELRTPPTWHARPSTEEGTWHAQRIDEHVVSPDADPFE